ncbi:uncharacterized protein LOC143155188 [Ptiloglossa arizonensis]|uniref:uncharacterized protein LOC143155188 n=1 Tax=Ptiloglossa arizonensis TaxID=3350558 RepID=UPI003FA16E1F
MEEGNRVEVTIIDPTVKIPSSGSARSSTKTLSTIHECDSSKVSHSCFRNAIGRYADNADKAKSNAKCFPSSKQRLDSFRGFHSSFDIDLLLRYYACNSNMEKSIRKVFEKVNENDTSHPDDPFVNLVCKDIEQGPLVELGAVRKIFDLLRRSNTENASLFAFRIQETLIELQSLIDRYNGKELEQILSSDPSMRICKYCGVISCTESPNTSIEQRQSPPRTSYFLNAQTFANNANGGDNNTRIPGALDKFNLRRKQQTEKIKNRTRNGTGSSVHKFGNVQVEANAFSKQEDKLYTDAPRKVEIMIAERENDNEETCGEQSVPEDGKPRRNKTRAEEAEKLSKVESQEQDNVSRTTQSSHIKERKLRKKPGKMVPNVESALRMKINSNFQVKGKAKNVVSVDFPRNFLRGKFHDRLVGNVAEEKEVGKISNEIHRNGNEFKEKVLNDVLYVKSYSELADSKTKMRLDNGQGIKSKQNQSSSPINNIASIIDTMTYLAHGRLEPVDAKKKEFVSQFDNGAWVQSKYYNNKHSFVLHANRDYNPQLDSALRLHEESKQKELVADVKHEATTETCYDRAEGWKWLKRVKNVESPDSFNCLMDEDSLENLIERPSSMPRSGQSDTTASSSSSVENLIHEWVKPLESKESSVQEDEVRQVSKSLLSNEPRTSDSNEKHEYHKETSIDQQRDLQSNSQYQTRCSSNEPKEILSTVGRNDSYDPGDDSNLKTSKESIDQKESNKKSKKVNSVGRKKFTIRRLFGSLKSFKSTKSMKSSDDSSVKFPTFSSNDSTDDSLKNITRRISYDQSLLKTMIGDGQSDETRNALSRYQRILKDTEKMDWESFQRFVENLHTGQKHLWRDICNAINKEARRLADKDDGVTEVCIEISSVPREETKSEGRECSNEIVFEMDMTLRDVEGFLDRQLASTKKGQLDTLERASEVIRVRNDDVCNTEVVSNQAE